MALLVATEAARWAVHPIEQQLALSRALLLAAGQDEAQNNLEMGALGAALPLLLGLGALARAAARPAAG